MRRCGGRGVCRINIGGRIGGWRRMGGLVGEEGVEVEIVGVLVEVEEEAAVVAILLVRETVAWCIKDEEL